MNDWPKVKTSSFPMALAVTAFIFACGGCAVLFSKHIKDKYRAAIYRNCISHLNTPKKCKKITAKIDPYSEVKKVKRISK